jgi:hypothetical protein
MLPSVGPNTESARFHYFSQVLSERWPRPLRIPAMLDVSGDTGFLAERFFQTGIPGDGGRRTRWRPGRAGAKVRRGLLLRPAGAAAGLAGRGGPDRSNGAYGWGVLLQRGRAAPAGPVTRGSGVGVVRRSPPGLRHHPRPAGRHPPASGLPGARGGRARPRRRPAHEGRARLVHWIRVSAERPSQARAGGEPFHLSSVGQWSASARYLNATWTGECIG